MKTSDLSSIQKEKIRKLLKSGKNIDRICKMTGISRYHIARLWQELLEETESKEQEPLETKQKLKFIPMTIRDSEESCPMMEIITPTGFTLRFHSEQTAEISKILEVLR